MTDIIAAVNVDALIAEEFDIEENINYQLIESQLKMSELSLKGAKATVLPIPCRLRSTITRTEWEMS